MSIRVKRKPISENSSSNKKSPVITAKLPFKKFPVFSLWFPVIIIIGILAFSGFAIANPADEIASKQSQAETIAADIQSLNRGLEGKVQVLANAQYELKDIEANIGENEARLKETSEVMQVAQARLEKRVVSLYREGSMDFLNVLMETSDINEFMANYDLLTKISEQDQNDLDQVKSLKSQIEEKQTRLAEEQARQSALISQIDSEKAAIESGIKEKEAIFSGLQADMAALVEQQRQAAIQREFEESLAAARAAEAEAAAEVATEDGNAAVAVPPPPAASGSVVDIAMQYLGIPYVWGGTDPSGFDCSGLVMYVYAQVGINLPRTTWAQWEVGTHVSYEELAPGDLVFFNDLNHVGLYIGNGSIIHAPFEGDVVKVDSLSGGGSYYGAVRV